MGVQYKTGRYFAPIPGEVLAENFRQRLVSADRDPKTGRRHQARSAVAKVKRVPARKLQRLLTRGAIAGAVLAAAAGCATLDPNLAKAWTIEPVLNVTHSLQSSQSYYTMGRYHDGSQAWDKSVLAYRKAIAADAQNIEAYNALGVALARAGQLEQAETTLRQAVALDPSRPHMRSNLGYVLLLARKAGDAVVELEAAVLQDSGNLMAAANLLSAREQLNQAAAQAAADNATSAAAAAADPARMARAERARSTVGLELGVPMPITTATVPAPLSTTITVAAPIQTVAVPAMLTVVAATAPAPADKPKTVAAIRVADQPTVGALDKAVDENVNNTPMAPQAVARRAELPLRVPSSDDLTVRLEVSNGNGVPGMAARVGKWLGEQGIKTATLTNQRPYTQQTTTVQYSSGHEEAAQRVARSLPAPAEPASAPTQGLRGDVRVVLGRDWVKVGACINANTCRPELTGVTVARADK